MYNMVFDLMRDNRLCIKRSKCTFGGTSMAYLGHVISADGITMDPEKVSVVDSWQPPRTLWAL
jgi:hypothetical protein